MSLEERERGEVSVINLIPNKPPCRLGPFQLHNDHLVSANLHKKILRRSEKLYLTEKTGAGAKGANRVLFMVLGAFLLVALLVGVTIFCAVGGEEQFVGHKPMTTPLDSTTSTTIAELHSSTPTTTGAPFDAAYLPYTADVEFSLVNVTWEEALANNSSTPFQDLSNSLHESVVEVLTRALNLSGILMQVQVFSPGDTVYVKLRLAWTKPPLPVADIGLALASTSSLGQYPIKHLKSYGVYNMCKFMNNGCSHNCSFIDFHFHCTCPHPLTLVPETKQCALAIVTTSETTNTGSTQASPTSPQQPTHPPYTPPSATPISPEHSTVPPIPSSTPQSTVAPTPTSTPHSTAAPSTPTQPQSEEVVDTTSESLEQSTQDAEETSTANNDTDESTIDVTIMTTE